MIEVYREIEKHMAERGYPPSLRELAAACGIGLGTVHQRLTELEEAGWISRDPKRGRAIRLTKKEQTQ